MHVIEKLGQGGFGHVYKVRNEHGHLLAMKTLQPEKPIVDELGMDQLKARFAREVRYQSAVKHPNVVPIIGANLEGEPPCFYMPLAECTLADELSIDRALGGRVKSMLFDVLNGIEAIHMAGYVHRDLKPSNVLRFPTGDGSPIYAVSDFGLMSSPNGMTTTLTATDAAGGTPFYAAPELVTNLKRATSAADIYSVGAILHDIFVAGNRLPYSHLNNGSGLIGEVIEKCTRTSAKLRYRSVQELREALFHALDHFVPTFSSDEESVVVGMLSANSNLSLDEWERVILLLEKHEAEGKSISNVIKALNVAHLESVALVSADVFAAIALDFCTYVIRGRGRFDFDYCDVLAGQLAKLFELGNTEHKAISLLALLVLGTSHNRWFVERKFVELASGALDEQVARRFLVEASVLAVSLEQAISHLEWSISVSRTQLSPVILAGLVAP